MLASADGKKQRKFERAPLTAVVPRYESDLRETVTKIVRPWLTENVRIWKAPTRSMLPHWRARRKSGMPRAGAQPGGGGGNRWVNALTNLWHPKL